MERIRLDIPLDNERAKRMWKDADEALAACAKMLVADDVKSGFDITNTVVTGLMVAAEADDLSLLQQLMQNRDCAITIARYGLLGYMTTVLSMVPEEGGGDNGAP